MDRHKQKFCSFLEKEVKSLQKKILDLAEVVLPQENFKTFRSKVLGATNDLYRDVQFEVNKNYNLKYDPATVCEDIIQVTSNFVPKKER